jgi:large subunit ribosomal protein L6
MSRVGKTPISVPKEVSIAVSGRIVNVKGPKGELTVEIPQGISVKTEADVALVEYGGGDRRKNAFHGLVRSLLYNSVVGVSQGWTKSLELSGVGYRANVNGQDLVLNVGFSHQVTIQPPAGITFAISEGKIVVSGIDKQLVGQVAAKIREVKKPEPYKGKGIRYVGERVRKKAGKAAKAVGGTGA